MTDAEWALIERRLPARRRLGRPRKVRLRSVIDTNGLLFAGHVHPANIQDCHGAVPLLKQLLRTAALCHG